jgi:hypothetical protein
MRGPRKWSGITTDLVIGDGVSNIIHQFGHDLDILFVCCVAHSLDAIRDLSELAFDPIEGSREDSA